MLCDQHPPPADGKGPRPCHRTAARRHVGADPRAPCRRPLQVLRSIGAIGPADSVQHIIRGPEFLGSSAPTIARHAIELYDITDHTVDELVTQKVR